jgi:hypothetical protein
MHMGVEIIDISWAEIIFAATQHRVPTVSTGGLIEIKTEWHDT